MRVPESQLDDVSQEVFVVVFRQLPNFEARSSIRTWLYGICRNVAFSARRKHGGGRELATEEPPDAGELPTQESSTWVKQAHAQLSDALSKLDEDQRMVFVLYEIEELTMDEVADAIGAPVTTCYSRLYAARDKVQALIRRKTRLAVGSPAEVTK